MSEETTTGPNVMAGDIITRPGLYESRGGDIVPITGWDEGWWVSEWNGTVDWYGSDGRQRFDGGLELNRWDLLHWVRPLPANEVEPETTTEQLAEIEPQPEPIQVREGRWRTRNGEVKDVKPTPTEHALADSYPWWDRRNTWRNDGRFDTCDEHPLDLLKYLGPIESEPQPEPQATDYTPPEGWRLLEVGATLREGDVSVRADGHLCPTERVGSTVGTKQRYIRPIEIEPEPEAQPEPDTELQAQVAFLKGREVTLGTRLQQEREVTTRLRSELQSTQFILGETERRTVELEELVKDLRTINDAAEKAVDAAGQENTALRRQLEAVKEELKIAAAVCQQLQIELDAAQQVPQAIADRFEEGWNQGTARAVETVLAWLEPIRLIDHPNLANETMQHLPQIMRHLTGLAQD